MEQFPQNEEIYENVLESQKAEMAESIEEVADLVVEKNGMYTEKAKLLLMRIAKVASGAVAVGAGAAALTAMGVGVYEVVQDSSITQGDREFLYEAMNLTAFVAAIGAIGMVQCQEIINKIKTKIASATV